MYCWICSRSTKFCLGVVQFVRVQQQWAGLHYRCFQGDVIRMANDLASAIALPDVIILDQRGGWDSEAGIELCRAMKRRNCYAHIIYLDMTMTRGVTARYLVDVHEDDEFVDIVFDTIEMAHEKWEMRLLEYVEEALEVPLSIIRNRPAGTPTPPHMYSKN